MVCGLNMQTWTFTGLSEACKGALSAFPSFKDAAQNASLAQATCTGWSARCSCCCGGPQSRQCR